MSEIKSFLFQTARPYILVAVLIGITVAVFTPYPLRAVGLVMFALGVVYIYFEPRYRFNLLRAQQAQQEEMDRIIEENSARLGEIMKALSLTLEEDQKVVKGQYFGKQTVPHTKFASSTNLNRDQVMQHQGRAYQTMKEALENSGEFSSMQAAL